VFLNQFGFDQKSCGRRMPEDMEFMDIRRGTDVEFGQSIYEPFGIAQLEPLTFGGICVVTNVCGCAGFLRDAAAGQNIRNVILADYTTLSNCPGTDIEDLLQIDRKTRDRIEAAEGARVAREILERLPRTDAQLERMIHEGHRLACEMSWDRVVCKYLLRNLLQTRDRQVKQTSCVGV